MLCLLRNLSSLPMEGEMLLPSSSCGESAVSPGFMGLRTPFMMGGSITSWNTATQIGWVLSGIVQSLRVD